MKSSSVFFAMASAAGVNLDEVINEVLNADKKFKESDKWYSQLDLNQKINLKELTDDICGMSFQFMVKMFGFREAIFHIHSKLRLIGFDV